jgi:hypothetical protein
MQAGDDMANLPDAMPAIMLASKRGKRRCALLVTAAVIVLALFFFVVQPALIEVLATRPGKARVGLHLVQGMFVGLGLCGIALATVLIRNAQRILQRGQTPVDDGWLWRDTPIVRGARARRTAWFSIAVGIVTILFCVGLSVTICLMLERSGASPFKLRHGVTIMEQKTL